MANEKGLCHWVHRDSNLEPRDYDSQTRVFHHLPLTYINVCSVESYSKLSFPQRLPISPVSIPLAADWLHGNDYKSETQGFYFSNQVAIRRRFDAEQGLQESVRPNPLWILSNRLVVLSKSNTTAGTGGDPVSRLVITLFTPRLWSISISWAILNC